MVNRSMQLEESAGHDAANPRNDEEDNNKKHGIQYAFRVIMAARVRFVESPA